MSSVPKNAHVWDTDPTRPFLALIRTKQWLGRWGSWHIMARFKFKTQRDKFSEKFKDSEVFQFASTVEGDSQ